MTINVTSPQTIKKDGVTAVLGNGYESKELYKNNAAEIQRLALAASKGIRLPFRIAAASNNSHALNLAGDDFQIRTDVRNLNRDQMANMLRVFNRNRANW